MKKVLIYDIQYFISDEDILSLYPRLPDTASDEDIEECRQDLIHSLPESISVELPEDVDTTDEDEVGEYLADFVTNETGCLVDGFMYELK